MNDWAGLAWLVVLLALNAFFVAAEFAVISARRSQIEPKAAAGQRSAKTALWAMEHATLMLAACQLGITVCSLLILNVSEPAIHHLLEYPLGALGWPEPVVDTVAFVITLVLVSFLHVIFGEMVPKNLSFSIPDRAVVILAGPLVAFARVFKYIIGGLNGLADITLKLFGVTPRHEANSAFTLEEVATIVDQSQREGLLEDSTGALSAAFEFTEKTVRELAIPLDRVVAFPLSVTPADLEHAVAQHGFSRYVLLDEAGDPTGYLHLKDVLGVDDAQAERPVPTKRIRRLLPLLAETELEDALTAMRRAGSHLARVVDASGQNIGVLFLEDIIEELVGEVRDATRRSVDTRAHRVVTDDENRPK